MTTTDADQLKREARELNEDAGGGDDPRGDQAAGGAGGAPGEEGGDQAAGGEYVENPAPKIAAALKSARLVARQNTLLRRVIPPRVLEVFDDETCDALGNAFGPLAIKYAPAVTPQLVFILDEWKDELTAALVVLGVVSRVTEAANQEGAPTPGERDVGGHDASREGRDPPPPGTEGVRPVEPL